MRTQPDRREALRRWGVLGGAWLWAGCNVSPPPPTRGRQPKSLPAGGPAAPQHAYGSGEFQFGELHLPEGAGPHPVAVAVHGGFWQAAFDLEHLRPFCAALADDEWAVWCIEYRRVGNPGGGWPGTFLDVAAAADHVRTLAPKHRLDLGRVVAVGHSAGGHLALWLAARHRIAQGRPLHCPDPIRLRGAVSLAGIGDLTAAYRRRTGGMAVQWLLDGMPDEVPDRYADGSPAALLPLGTPQVLVHGGEDPIVPAEFGREYQSAAKAKGDDVALVELPDTGHFDLIHPQSDAWPAVRAAMARFRQ